VVEIGMNDVDDEYVEVRWLARRDDFAPNMVIG
jgi:hypothetical protein